jgi:hypothetical protein
LLEDYFGIDINSLASLEENDIKLNLENRLTQIKNNLISKTDFLIPNSLISIKFRVPFMFVNKLALYLSKKYVENFVVVNDDDNIADDNNFIQNLISNYINLYRTIKFESIKSVDILNRLLIGC